jgi:hypothetical protein
MWNADERLLVNVIAGCMWNADERLLVNVIA